MLDGISILKAARAVASWGLRLAAGGAFLWVIAAPGQTDLPTLTNAHQVHLLASDLASLGYPVRLRGVITFYSTRIGELFVQDETEGIYVEIYRDRTLFPFGFRVQPGQLVEVEGVSGPGFAPDVIPRRIQLLGKAQIPPARAVTFEQIAMGQEDCNWVEFSGVVRATDTDKWTRLPALEVVGAGGRVVVPILDYDPEQGQWLVDAEISVQGVCTTVFNRKGALMHPMLQVSSMADIKVKKPASTDPFRAKARPIDDLLQYAPQGEHGHRVKVEGTVMLQQPGQALFIADKTGGLFVQTKQTNQVAVGDVVEALGFPGAGEYISPVLQDTVFRRLGAGPPMAPLQVEAGLERKDLYDATLIQVEAELLNRVRRRNDEILELQSSNSIFYAQLGGNVAQTEPLAEIPSRSRVRLTGICQVRADQFRSETPPQSFSLLLRSGSDVLLLERPSWWSVQHTLWVLGATLVVFFASLIWVAVLRKQVKAQTQIIKQKAQREAATEERTRIARDLHDDLGAGLTHISFLSEVAQKEERCPAPVEKHLRAISNSAQDSFRALDEIVWVVNPKNDTLDNLASYMCHFAEGFFRGTSTRYRLDVPASLPERAISTEMRNNLFFAVKEALNNVRKHARATEVLLRIGMESSGVNITIEDNGRGFAPEGLPSKGNGLANMRKRLEKIGGEFALESRSGAGTRIRLIVPL